MAIHDILFSLLRLSLGTRADEMDFSAFTNADWKELIDLSFDQGVAAIAVDGLQKSLELVPEPVEGSAESLELSLDSPELEAEIKAIIAEVGAKTAQEMGKVMGVATKKLAGLAEGKTISAIVRNLLAGN